MVKYRELMFLGNVAVVGSVNLDLVFRSARLPSPGETLIGATFATHPGGKGANQAVAIARLGGAPAFIGCVGDDPSGRELTDTLRGYGVSLDHLAVDAHAATGTASIVVDDEAHNMIVVASGANLSVTPAQVSGAFSVLQPRVVLSQLEVPMDAVAAAAGAELFVLNPAPASEIPCEILAQCFAVTPNETETQLLTGILPTDEDSCDRAASILRDRGVANVVITLGSRGCYWNDGSGSKVFAPPPVKPVDTTAAGDAFNGALVHFLSLGRDMENSLQLANCVAALSTTKHGALGSMPDLDAVKQIAGALY